MGPALRRRRLLKRDFLHRASQWTAEALRNETAVSYSPQAVLGGVLFKTKLKLCRIFWPWFFAFTSARTLLRVGGEEVERLIALLRRLQNRFCEAQPIALEPCSAAPALQIAAQQAPRLVISATVRSATLRNLFARGKRSAIQPGRVGNIRKAAKNALLDSHCFAFDGRSHAAASHGGAQPRASHV